MTVQEELIHVPDTMAILQGLACRSAVCEEIISAHYTCFISKFTVDLYLDIDHCTSEGRDYAMLTWHGGNLGIELLRIPLARRLWPL